MRKEKKNGVLIEKNAPIFFRLTYNGNRINLYTGYRVDLKDWDEKKEQVNPKITYPNKESGEDINNKLAEYKSILRSFQLKEVMPSKEEIKTIFQNAKNNSKENIETNSIVNNNLFEVLDIFITDAGKVNNWTSGTKKKFEALKNHLLTFDKSLSFEDLNKERLSNFFKNKLKNVITKKYIKNLKWFLRYAVKNSYTENTDFENFNPKIKDISKKIIFLSEEEIERIKTLNIPETKQYLHRVRDYKLTGLRYSDVQKLKKSDIKDNWIELMTKKQMIY